MSDLKIDCKKSDGRTYKNGQGLGFKQYILRMVVWQAHNIAHKLWYLSFGCGLVVFYIRLFAVYLRSDGMTLGVSTMV